MDRLKTKNTKRRFDYYIYVDYSENLIGHIVIEGRKIRQNLDIFVEVIEFVEKNDNCVIFVSVDNNQYNSFMKLVRIVPSHEHFIVIRESELKEGSAEYRLSLIIDTMLNIERRKIR